MTRFRRSTVWLMVGNQQEPASRTSHGRVALRFGGGIKVLFSAVFAVSAVIVGFSTHFQRLTAIICNSTRAPAFSAAT